MITKNCAIDKFISSVGNKKLICFGAGPSGKKFVELFLEEGIENTISCFIDNDKAKWGSTVTIGSREIPVRSPEMLKGGQLNPNESVIFITNRFWDQIHAQLETVPALTEVDCYVYLLMKAKATDSAFIIPEGPSLIPKKIHYCWFGKNPMSENEIRCIESWKKYCPDYEIIRWDESNYDVCKTKNLQYLYERRHYNTVCDYARMDILNEYGGIYYDTDVEVVKNIDELLRLPAFMGFDVGNFVNTGHGFGIMKRNGICKEILDFYNTMPYIGDEERFDSASYLYIVGQILDSHGLITNGIMQKIEDIIIFPNDYFDPVMQMPTKNTYSIHRYSSLWSYPSMNMADVWKKQREYWDELKRGGHIVDV